MDFEILVSQLTNNCYTFTTTVSMATKLGRIVNYLGSLLPIKSHDPLITWSCKIIWKTKIMISSLPQCLWPPNLAGQRSCEITWQTKIIITPLPQCLWSPKLVSWWLTMRVFQPSCYSTLWSCGLVRSRDKLKTLYLHYHNAYGHKTRQDDVLPWVTSTHEVTWPYNHVVL